MKKLLYITFLSVLTINAQETTENISEIKVGNILVIGSPSTTGYQHIYFPKTNFIIKRGGIANYKHLIGKKVIVNAIETNAKNERIVVLKRDDKMKFFNRYTSVRANLDSAIESGEIKP